MPKCTADEFMNRHLEHRMNVLRGFKDRSGEESPNAHGAMKDGAIITCRVLWKLLGVTINSTKETVPNAPNVQPIFKSFNKFPSGINSTPFTEKDFNALPTITKDDITMVLVAANKCVAHIDLYPDHGVTEEVLDRVIDVTLDKIKKHIKNT